MFDHRKVLDVHDEVRQFQNEDIASHDSQDIHFDPFHVLSGDLVTQNDVDPFHSDA